MPRWAHNKMSAAVKKQYFELIREGYNGAAAARVVGVSTSCGSLWFLDAGGMLVPEAGPISPRFLDQDDRIAIADGLSAGRAVKEIAAAIGKSFQTVYREVKRNSKPDGSYQPWWAHNRALQRRKRPRAAKLGNGPGLSDVVRAKLEIRWSPQQISRYLGRSYPGQPAMQACAETIYRGLFAGVLGNKTGKLRTGAFPPQAPSQRRCRSEQDQEHDTSGPASGRGHRTAGPGTLGRRPHHRQLRVRSRAHGHRDPGRAGHQVPHPRAPASRLQGPPAARRADHPDPGHPASVAQDTDVGSRPRDVDARADRRSHRLRRVLLRPAFPLAAGPQREHQRTDPPVLPQAH